jgi:hypothetical protein
MNERERVKVDATPDGTCLECGWHFDDASELRRHIDRHTGAARGSDDAGGVLPEGQQADTGAGRVQTE